MDPDQILARLEALGDPRNVAGMERYGIRSKKAFGAPTPAIRTLAKRIGRNHQLALALWQTEVLDARAVAFLIDDPAQVSERQMESWVRDFDCWSVCDGCCSNLFDKTPYAWRKALEWSRRDEEYVKRAAFTLMAALAVHDKQAPDGKFLRFLPVIRRESADGRNYVRKAVNWALRQIGKRNRELNRAAVRTAEEIHAIDAPSARWIASDALRELRSEAVQGRLKGR